MKKFKKTLATLMAVACTASALCVPISASAANTTALSETENNNTIAVADNISCNNVMSGAISTGSDVDYYSYFAPATGYVEIQLGVSSGSNYNIVLYNSNGNALATSCVGGVGYGESIRYYVSANTVYYIKVYPQSSSSYGGTYSLYASYPFTTTNTWYPQINAIATDNYTRWNTYKLDNLYYNNGSKPFMINGSKSDYMYQGCAIASVAMVLHNMNAKTVDKIVDFRTGYKGYAYADPFTVSMANISKTVAPVYSNSKYGYTHSTSLSTIGINSWSGIASKFGKTANTSHTAIWSNAVKLVSSYPQGVIVKFRKYVLNSNGDTVEKTHYVVLTKASNADGYLIYDVGTNGSSGNGKTWSNSYTSQNYSQSQVVDVITIS